MTIDNKLETGVILDGLGHGVLIFASDGKLITDNLTARTILSTDIKMLRDQGWSAASMLFHLTGDIEEQTLDSIREQALQSARPVRFHIYRSGQYVPCWATGLTGQDGQVYTMITLEQLDWTVVGNVIDRFRREIQDSIDSTIGHVNLINKTMATHKPDDSLQTLMRRMGGFFKLISIHMSRSNRLMVMMQRLEDIRVGQTRENVREERQKILLDDYFEDFLEELEEVDWLDPETEVQDYRGRLRLDIPENLYVYTSKRYLGYVLRDLLRNAIMYSLHGVPISMKAHKRNGQIQDRCDG